MNASDRVGWIDAARGIGIVLVVAGHVERGLVAAKMAHGPVWAWMDYGLYTFHMPLFFLLAGLNVPSSIAKGRRRFLISKLWTIAYPYVLWSLIQGSVLVALSSTTNSHLAVSDLLAIGWRPIGQFWFLYALMGCQLAAFLLVPSLRLLAAAAAVALAFAAAMPQYSFAEKYLHAFPFFAVGIIISERRPAWSHGGDLLRSGAAAIALALVVALSGELDGMDSDALLALPAAVCGIVLLVSVSRLLAGGLADVAERLGQMSMSIYVMHILAAAGSRIALVKLHVPLNPWLYLAVCTIVGVLAPVTAHLWLSRHLLLAPLGLASWRRVRASSEVPEIGM